MLLVLLYLSYVNLFKELFLYSLPLRTSVSRFAWGFVRSRKRMQRYDFFPFLQNFSWKKLKIYCCFNTCLQNEGGFVGVHIIIYIICGCPGNAWQGQKPSLRIGGTMPHPASLRNFYTCTRRHRGEMSLTEMCGKAHRGRNRRLGSATMADFLGEVLCELARIACGCPGRASSYSLWAVEPKAGHGMAASPTGDNPTHWCMSMYSECKGIAFGRNGKIKGGVLKGF